MNVLICIGCNTYSFLQPLDGAEKDATDIYNSLLKAGTLYETSTSQLLVSPDDLQLRRCLAEMFCNALPINILTFFFAGHAGVKCGNLYLCSSNSDAERLSTTAFPIIDFFAMINEFHPKQVNIVLDACQAGGSSFDLHELQKEEIVGSSDSTCLTFLGACASNQYAQETSQGGVLTAEILKCVTGQVEIQSRTPFLDLIQIAAISSRTVHLSFPDQKPIAWGLNLFGWGQFVQNPHYGGIGIKPEFPLHAKLDNDNIRDQIQLKSSDLWQEAHAIKEGFDANRLLQLFARIFPQSDKDPDATIPFLQMLTRTLAFNAGESGDILAKSQCLAASAVFLLPSIANKSTSKYVADTFSEILATDAEAWQRLSTSLVTDPFAICDRHYPNADLYLLPIRITKVLGWIGWNTIAEHLVPSIQNGSEEMRFRLASQIVDKYESSLVAVSEAQAPFLYVFIKGCLLRGQVDLASKVVNIYYWSLSEKRGNITDAMPDARRVLSYFKSIGASGMENKRWRPANPLAFLSVLLLAGNTLGITSAWSLRSLDRKYAGFYIPNDYLIFGRKIMDDGTNYLRKVGFDFWNATEFALQFDNVVKRTLPSVTKDLSNEAIALISLAALLLPDRLPMCLESITHPPCPPATGDALCPAV